jgi:hypothetical protein
MRPRPLLPLLAGLLLASLAAAEAPAPPRRVLFVGNSLTVAHDLPGLVAALSRVRGDEPPLEVAQIAFGNFSLADHWSRGEALRTIDSGGWDVVVLQQGPSAAPENRAHLATWTRRFAKRIRKSGGRPALYMVWPSAERAGDFDGVAAAYRNAATAVEGLLLPAGDAWRAAWRLAPDLELYGEDDFHPSLLGSYLTAVTIYCGITGREPDGLPVELELAWGTVEIGAEMAELAGRAAREALATAAAE